jgi:citronellol/citronellal dehydrogenase
VIDQVIGAGSTPFAGARPAFSFVRGLLRRRAESDSFARVTHLRGKTLLITGASRGIGLSMALRAARDGANVAIAAKTKDPHPKLPGTIYTAAEEIERAGGKALPLICDIRYEDQIALAVAETVSKFGGIDVLINNASAISLTGTEATPMKRFDLMHGVKLVFRTCDAPRTRTS